ncbi:SDR family oxidoreductase [Massilia sp. W12]|uniref:SDR family NAD(P)-dependent oxidoreductase n=1 Tax=Massilia sp. W12 TaxID=3126507 RepID=UPI0030D182B9
MTHTSPALRACLNGKRALLTGASRGLGSLLAQELAACGVELLLSARNHEQLQQLRQSLQAGGARAPIHLHPCDLGNSTEVLALAQEAKNLFGAPDILINNAGLMHTRSSSAAICQMLAVNLQAPMLLTDALLPAMQARNSGHILNLASVAGFLPVEFGDMYAAGKHGLVGFTRSLRATMQRQGSALAVSLICPGFVSGAGMYADQAEAHGIHAPPLVGAIPAPEVVAYIVRTLARAQSHEKILAPFSTRLSCMCYNLAPRLTAWSMNLARAHTVFERVAKRSD